MDTKILRISLLFLPALLSWTSVHAGPIQDLTFTDVIKEVLIIDPATKKESPAKVGDKLVPPNVLKTGADSRAELVAEDKTVTRVGSNTIFSVEANSRDVNLAQGSVLFHAPSGRGGGRIKSAGATASVLGTTLAVSANAAGGFKTSLLEGKGEVKDPKGAKVNLVAGQVTFAKPGGGLSPALNFDLKAQVANSKLVGGFSKPLASIAKIEAAISVQQAKLASGAMASTGMLIGDRPDTAFKVDSNLLASILQGVQQRIERQTLPDRPLKTEFELHPSYLTAVMKLMSLKEISKETQIRSFDVDDSGKFSLTAKRNAETYEIQGTVPQNFPRDPSSLVERGLAAVLMDISLDLEVNLPLFTSKSQNDDPQTGAPSENTYFDSYVVLALNNINLNRNVAVDGLIGGEKTLPDGSKVPVGLPILFSAGNAFSLAPYTILDVPTPHLEIFSQGTKFKTGTKPLVPSLVSTISEGWNFFRDTLKSLDDPYGALLLQDPAAIQKLINSISDEKLASEDKPKFSNLLAALGGELYARFSFDVLGEVLEYSPDQLLKVLEISDTELSGALSASSKTAFTLDRAAIRNDFESASFTAKISISAPSIEIRNSLIRAYSELGSTVSLNALEGDLSILNYEALPSTTSPESSALRDFMMSLGVDDPRDLRTEAALVNLTAKGSVRLANLNLAAQILNIQAGTDISLSSTSLIDFDPDPNAGPRVLSASAGATIQMTGASFATVGAGSLIATTGDIKLNDLVFGSSGALSEDAALESRFAAKAAQALELTKAAIYADQTLFEGASVTVTGVNIEPNGSDLSEVTMTAKTGDLKMTALQGAGTSTGNVVKAYKISLSAGKDLIIEDTLFSAPSSSKGNSFDARAVADLSLKNVTLSDAKNVALQANTILLQDVAFGESAKVDLTSRYGLMDTHARGASATPGRINVYPNVTYPVAGVKYDLNTLNAKGLDNAAFHTEAQKAFGNSLNNITLKAK